MGYQTMNHDFEQIRVGLPAVIQRYADAGYLTESIRLIDEMMDTVIDEAMKKSMRAHREMFLRTPMQFPYSVSEVLTEIRKQISDFQESELKMLMESGDINWRMIDGKPQIFKGFMDNLQDESAYFKARCGVREEEQKRRNFVEETIAEMQAAGGLGYHYKIRFELGPKEAAVSDTDKTLIHIPIPLEAGMIHNVAVEDASPEPLGMNGPSDLAGSIAFAGQGMQKCSVTYSFDNYCDYLDLYHAEGSGKESAFCLEEQEPHIVFTPYLRSLAETIVKDAVTPLQRARKIYDYITQEVVYAFVPDYITMENIPDQCARSLRGDCGVQVLLFITLCRIAGVPARWQSGLDCSDDAPSPHDWAQVYIDPYGWRNVDLTYGGGGRPEWRYFGNTDPLRMITCLEFGADHAVEKTFYRADPYDDQYGEIETGSRGLWLSELNYKRQFLEREKFRDPSYLKRKEEERR